MNTNKDLITVTSAAINKIKSNLARRGKGQGIHVGVRTTGCSGLAYTLEYLDDLEKLDPGFTRSFDNFCVYIR